MVIVSLASLELMQDLLWYLVFKVSNELKFRYLLFFGNFFGLLKRKNLLINLFLRKSLVILSPPSTNKCLHPILYNFFSTNLRLKCFLFNKLNLIKFTPFFFKMSTFDLLSLL